MSVEASCSLIEDDEVFLWIYKSVMDYVLNEPVSQN